MFRHPYHDITVTFDHDMDGWYGIVRISRIEDGECGDFIKEKDIPQKIVDKLVQEFGLEDKIKSSRGFPN